MNRTLWKMVRWIPLVKRREARNRFWQCIHEASMWRTDPLVSDYPTSADNFRQFAREMKYARWYDNISVGKSPFKLDHRCKKCGSHLVDGMCSDVTCPYSDRTQNTTYTVG